MSERCWRTCVASLGAGTLLSPKRRPSVDPQAVVPSQPAATCCTTVHNGDRSVPAPGATRTRRVFFDPPATNWTDLRLFSVTGAVTVATDTNAVPCRFYRAVIP